MSGAVHKNAALFRERRYRASPPRQKLRQLLLDLVFLDLIEKRRVVDLQHLRRLALVAANLTQYPQNGRLFGHRLCVGADLF